MEAVVSEKPWLLSNDLEAQKQQPGNTKSKHSSQLLVPPSRSTRQLESPFIHPEETGTSSNTSYTTKIHLPRDTFADQMEYLSIHELCEVQPRLPKGPALKELGLSSI